MYFLSNNQLSRGTPVSLHYSDQPVRIGDKYGRWEVIGGATPAPRGQKKWQCRCECGTVRGVYDRLLRAKDEPGRSVSRSCGCLVRDKRWKGTGKIAMSVWQNILHGAKSRGIEVAITIADAWSQALEQGERCAITGVALVFPGSTNSKNAHRGTASLDRIDSTKGYVPGNIQWVHKRINMMKNRFDQEEFIFWCNRVAEMNPRNTEIGVAA